MSQGHSSDLRTLRSWSFITSHGHVLLAVARRPAATVVELAAAAEITERTTYRILADLQRAGYVQRRKVGRHNAYKINPALPLRDPMVEDECVRNLLGLVAAAEDVEGHGGVIALPRALTGAGNQEAVQTLRAMPERAARRRKECRAG